METFGNIFTPKNAEYFCNFCDFNCSKKSDWNRHCQTLKHTHRHNGNKMEILETNFTPFTPITPHHSCVCGKKYLTHSGLWKHKKKCTFYENIDTETGDKDQLILMLIKQNSELIKETSEFKNVMMEVIKNGTHNNITNMHNTNSHNKSFNLQFFLNETCKDAMNIMDFVDSIKLQLTDLEKIGEIGYVNGISNIIVKNLKQLDITERPVHCTDKKRETLYIKDENKWEKEDNENNKMRKVIKKVANKNIRLLQKFKEEHPDCGKSDSTYSDQYNKLIVESMGGSGDNNLEKEDKIIRKIAKEVIIDKE